MRFHFQLDLAEVIAGVGPAPSLVLLLIQRLPDTCLTIAPASGGRDHFGWGVDRHLAADTYDAINTNTRATGNFKKPPKIELWPRPKLKNPSQQSADGTPKKVTVRDLYRNFKTQFLGG